MGGQTDFMPRGVPPILTNDSLEAFRRRGILLKAFPEKNLEECLLRDRLFLQFFLSGKAFPDRNLDVCPLSPQGNSSFGKQFLGNSVN